jgi:hypothetical protein
LQFTGLTNYFTVTTFFYLKVDCNPTENVGNRDKIARKGFKICSFDCYFSIVEILIRNVSFSVFTRVTGIFRVD